MKTRKETDPIVRLIIKGLIKNNWKKLGTKLYRNVSFPNVDIEININGHNEITYWLDRDSDKYVQHCLSHKVMFTVPFEAIITKIEEELMEARL